MTRNVVRLPRPFVLSTLTLLLAAPVAWAQQAPAAAPAAPAHEAQHEAAEGHEHRNELALVVAGTREEDAHGEDETAFTIGVEYERRLTRHVGIGAEVEYVDPDRWVFAAPFIFRPTPAFKLFTGPGFESAPAHEEAGGHRSEEESSRDTLFLWRVGTGYTWEFAERYSVGPTVYFDFVREHEEWKKAFVFGMTLGVAF